MENNLEDLNEKTSISTIASTLKEELHKHKMEYDAMSADGVIDKDELKRIIDTTQDLEIKARSLRENMDEDKKDIMDEIIKIIHSEQERMVNINSPEEDKDL